MTVVIRDARADDAPAIAPLLETLGYASDPAMIRQRWATLLKTDPTARVLVGEVDGQVLGVATLHVTPVLHRPTPVGRVTALAVLPASQGTGVERIEITSGLSHRPAYDFYRHLGYEDHGLRFAKAISPA